MKPLKKQVIDVINELPDDATYEDIFEEIHFKMQVEAGLKDLKDGRVLTHEEAKKRFSKCLSK